MCEEYGMGESGHRAIEIIPLELVGALKGAGFHLEGRKASDHDSVVDRPLDVLRRHWPAILELRPLAEMEGDRHAIGSDLPLFRQFRSEYLFVIRHRPIRKFLLTEGEQAAVAVPGDGIARMVGLTPWISRAFGPDCPMATSVSERLWTVVRSDRRRAGSDIQRPYLHSAMGVTFLSMRVECLSGEFLQ